ncbi:hypothetical protein [Demetria terragena]|uniref:hypothetical protein n=1 Tax=Demetria terragena TaxID=63959 RepID=UPI000373364B|nr:hypothetical protein [Demetria terragena]
MSPATDRPRRAVRPATGGTTQRGGAPEQTSDDLDAEATATDQQDEDHARWLQEQRPPHWE